MQSILFDINDINDFTSSAAKTTEKIIYSKYPMFTTDEYCNVFANYWKIYMSQKSVSKKWRNMNTYIYTYINIY